MASKVEERNNGRKVRGGGGEASTDDRIVAGRANYLTANDPRLQLSVRQYAAVLALAQYDKLDHDAIDAAALKAGVSTHRVQRWLKALYFRRALAAERDEPTGWGFRLLAMDRGPAAVSDERRRAALAALESAPKRQLGAHGREDDE